MVGALLFGWVTASKVEVSFFAKGSKQSIRHHLQPSSALPGGGQNGGGDSFALWGAPTCMGVYHFPPFYIIIVIMSTLHITFRYYYYSIVFLLLEMMHKTQLARQACVNPIGFPHISPRPGSIIKAPIRRRPPPPTPLPVRSTPSTRPAAQRSAG